MSLTARTRHGYGVGAFALALANTAVLFFLLKFLVDAVGLSPGTAGSLLLVSKLWDAVSDPVVGWLTDRTHSRHGPRRPWIALGAVPFAVTFAALFGGAGGSGPGSVWTYLALLLAYQTAYTCVVVPYGALTPSLTADYDERTQLNGARMGWSMAGGLVAGIAFPVLREVSGGWTLPATVLGVAMLPPLAITVMATAGRDAATEPTPSRPWEVLAVPAFRRVAVLFLAAWTTIAVLSALLPFYVEHHVGRADMLDAVLAVLQLARLAAIPVVVRVAESTSKHGAYAGSMAVFALCLLGMFALPSGALGLLLALAVVAGIGVAGAHVLPWAMLPDVVDADRARSGQDRAGAFYGMMTFLEKSATAVALGGLGWGLELGGYVEGAATQSPEAVSTLLWLVGPLPAVLVSAAAVYAAVRPPITREVHLAHLGAR
jgi:GPH family glycoside/pentoside/hexuronide:cation symporter